MGKALFTPDVLKHTPVEGCVYQHRDAMVFYCAGSPEDHSWDTRDAQTAASPNSTSLLALVRVPKLTQ